MSTNNKENGEGCPQIENKPRKKLSPKQEKFVQVYVKTGNATEAALQAYDVASRDVANALGGENLAKPSIQGAIAIHNNNIRDTIAQTFARNNTIAQVLDRLHTMALSDDPRQTIDAMRLIKDYAALGLSKDTLVDNRKILLTYPKG